MIIAVDFDGTLVEHKYPKIGKELPYCVEVLKKLLYLDHQIILYTMRGGKELDEAVEWLCWRGIKLWAVNENPDQHEWTTSPKVYAHIYIDDSALGCPRYVDDQLELIGVDWLKVEEILKGRGVL